MALSDDEDVEAWYLVARHAHCGSQEERDVQNVESRADWDAWIAEHDRKVAEAAWSQGWRERVEGGTPNPYMAHVSGTPD